MAACTGAAAAAASLRAGRAVHPATQPQRPRLQHALAAAGADAARADRADQAEKLSALLPDGESLGDAGVRIQNALSPIIAMSWLPLGSQHQLVALVDDIVKAMAH